LWELRGADLALVREQLGRSPLTTFAVVCRCFDGHPLVIRNAPVDHRGNPFPTLYWLTCPAAVRAVSRLEAEGWIKRLDDQAVQDLSLGEGLAAAHASYAEERARWGPGAGGGVGGAGAGIKCLHAHYAHHLAGGPDPIGAWVAERLEPVHPEEEGAERVAAVDVGTNSVRLLVATGDDLLELARDMVITRLGQDVDRTGRLSEAALGRTLDVLETYVRRARALGAARIRVAATSAVRDAENRGAFERGIHVLTGTWPEILGGEEEAALSFAGATASLDPPAPFLVFDIGGGSTELVLGRASPEAAASVDVGSVRITERVRPSDPPTSGDVAALRREAAEALRRAEQAVPPGRAATLVGVAGTTTTVQALALGLERYDPEAIHGSVLTRSEAETVARALAAMTTEQRGALPVMAPGREDVIVAGCQILLEILDRWGFERCVVSERDILDGLAMDMVSPRAGR
jgi:exopolyphosphatase/guanosine-5'-triphosphate,3'-diphosphate pyrophosphatase